MMQYSLSSFKKEPSIKKPDAAKTSELNSLGPKKVVTNQPIAIKDPYEPTLLGTLSKLKSLVAPKAESGFDISSLILPAMVLSALTGLVLASAEDFLSGLVTTVKDKVVAAKNAVLGALGIETKKEEADGKDGAPSKEEKKVEVVPESVKKIAPAGEATTSAEDKVEPKVEPPRLAAGAPSAPLVVPKPAPITLENPEPKPTELIGSVSRKEESGGGSGVVSTGKGDAGGVSYGTYQLASKKIGGGDSSVDEYIAQSKFKDRFKNLKAGSKTFSAMWVKVNDENQKAFADEQQAYAIKKYYDPVVKSDIAKSANLESRGVAIQELIVSTSIQYGASGARSVLAAALSDSADPSKLSDVDIIRRVQSAKKARLDAIPVRKDGPSNRAGLYARIEREKDTLIGLATNVPASASASTVEVPVRKVDIQAALSATSNVPKPEAATATVVAVNAPKAISAIKVSSSSSDPIVVPSVNLTGVGPKAESGRREPVTVASRDEPYRPSSDKSNSTPMLFRMRSGQLAVVN